MGAGERESIADEETRRQFSAKEIAQFKKKVASQLIMHAGHLTPKHGGGTELALECGWRNVELTSAAEKHGVVDIKESVIVDGVPVELQTARDLVRYGLLDKKFLPDRY